MGVTDDTAGTSIRGDAQPEIHRLGVAGGVAVLVSAPRPPGERENQDGVAVFPVDAERGVLAVADGMGGGRGGERASRIVVGCLARNLQRLGEPEQRVRDVILDAVEEANREILELGVGAATTLAAVDLEGPTLRPYHVGDSGVLVVGQRGKIKLRTTAHSPVGYAVEAGLLGEAEAMHHEDRHVVSNVLGMPEMRIDVGSRLRLAVRDTVLLATDGLFDNMTEDEVVRHVRAGPLDEAARSLVEVCRRRMTAPRPGEPSKPDDLTFVLFRPGRGKRIVP